MKKRVLSVVLAVSLLLSVFCCLGVGAGAAGKQEDIQILSAEPAADTSLINFEKCDEPINNFCELFNDLADFPVVGGILAFAHALMHVLAVVFA